MSDASNYRDIIVHRILLCNRRFITDPCPTPQKPTGAPARAAATPSRAAAARAPLSTRTALMNHAGSPELKPAGAKTGDLHVHVMYMFCTMCTCTVVCLVRVYVCYEVFLYMSACAQHRSLMVLDLTYTQVYINCYKCTHAPLVEIAFVL